MTNAVNYSGKAATRILGETKVWKPRVMEPDEKVSLTKGEAIMPNTGPVKGLGMHIDVYG